MPERRFFVDPRSPYGGPATFEVEDDGEVVWRLFECNRVFLAEHPEAAPAEVGEAPPGTTLCDASTIDGNGIRIRCASDWLDQDRPRPSLPTLRAGQQVVLLLDRQQINRVDFVVREANAKTVLLRPINLENGEPAEVENRVE